MKLFSTNNAEMKLITVVTRSASIYEVSPWIVELAFMTC